MTSQPWDMTRRSRMVEKMKKEAERAAARLGAAGCVVIAFWPEGDGFHMLDAAA